MRSHVGSPFPQSFSRPRHKLSSRCRRRHHHSPSSSVDQERVHCEVYSYDSLKTFWMNALRVRSLVGMLRQLGEPGKVELRCGPHVSRLLSKLPHDLRSSFRRWIYPFDVKSSTLLDFSNWLEYEIQVQEDSKRYVSRSGRGYSIESSQSLGTNHFRSFVLVLILQRRINGFT